MQNTLSFKTNKNAMLAMLSKYNFRLVVSSCNLHHCKLEWQGMARETHIGNTWQTPVPGTTGQIFERFSKTAAVLRSKTE